MTRDFPIEGGAAQPVYIVNPHSDHAGIVVYDGVTAQAGITTTPVKMTGFALNCCSLGAIPDHVNDQIMIGKDGNYLVLFQNSFRAASTTSSTSIFASMASSTLRDAIASWALRGT